MARYQLHLLVLSLIAYFSTSDALRCWSCSSDMDLPCSDYFNTTALSRQYNRYGNAPQLTECTHNNQLTYQTGKPVCSKKVQTSYGRTTYIRQCMYLHEQEKVGPCPAETTTSATTIDFCEYCDYDGCNGSSSLKSALLLTIISPLLYFFLKY
ncbi:PREDICTED: uncharacterized protein LOC108567386 [Nicrophorus vespilloides]|uniref:Uncharacterized protein LOC108567386 n=1 Tax=Nicrophorus vespilloides TaxID=110193 RepID=A0ABM1N8Z4_NICVS|nr:PREDICTED: uncharacterized protein LOC108567386 [Nicrophorus vespilloides]